jgi:hypothetical protein
MGVHLKFETPEIMQTAIDKYFKDCDEHMGKCLSKMGFVMDCPAPIPYTITGLAIALKTNRTTLLNYEKAEGYELYFDTVKDAKAKCENYAENHLFTGNGAAGAIFNLCNNYSGWHQRNDLNIGGQQDNRLEISVSYAPEKPKE